jgi:hypothetical protein
MAKYGKYCSRNRKIAIATHNFRIVSVYLLAKLGCVPCSVFLVTRI